jgi:TPR repeat protein
MNNLGWMYERGYGVTKDYRTAIEWYRRAADAGSEDSRKNLRRLNAE